MTICVSEQLKIDVGNLDLGDIFLITVEVSNLDENIGDNLFYFYNGHIWLIFMKNRGYFW